MILSVLITALATGAPPPVTIDQLDAQAREALARNRPEEADALWKRALKLAIKSASEEIYARPLPPTEGYPQPLPPLDGVRRLMALTATAAEAFARRGDVDRAIDWSQHGPLRSASVNLDLLRKLARIAKANGHDDEPYSARVTAEENRRTAAREEGERRHEQASRRNAVVLVAVVAVCCFVLIGLFVPDLRKARRAKARRRADLSKLTSLKVTARDEEQRPRAWKTTGFGILWSRFLHWFIRFTALSALFGAAVFWPFFVDETDDIAVAALLGFLILMFVGYALFIVLVDLVSPPRTVGREVDLQPHGLIVLSKYGFLQPASFKDELRFDDMTSVQMHLLRTPAQYVTIKEYTVIVETRIDAHARQMCVAGSPDPVAVRAVGEAIAAASGQPLRELE